MKTEIVRVPMEPEDKERLRVLSFQLRLTEPEILRRALALFLASEVTISNQNDQEREGAVAA
jgi:hypothetical protein